MLLNFPNLYTIHLNSGPNNCWRSVASWISGQDIRRRAAPMMEDYGDTADVEAGKRADERGELDGRQV